MRVEFDFIGKRISIDGDGPELLEVLKSAREVAPHISEINLVTSGTSPIPVKQAGQFAQQSSTETGHLRGLTLKQFAKSLRLDNLSEKITAIAYYAKHHQQEESFSPKSMAQSFTFCGFQKPPQMGVAFSDARRQHGYIENVGRGEWRITTNGENLIIGKLNENETAE